MLLLLPIDKKNIFISYSWDNEVHKQWVLRLAKILSQQDNFNIILDRTHLKYGGNTKVFMRWAIEACDIVLIILTPNYADKAKNRKGGVGYEYYVINKQLMSCYENNEKFIPVLREGTIETSFPDYLDDFLCCNMTNDAEFNTKVQEIINQINGFPITIDSLLELDK